MIPFIIQGNTIVLYVNGAPVIIDTSHVNYTHVKEAILAQDWEKVKEMATVKAAVKKASNGRVTVSEDEVLFDGKAVHNALSRRMIQMFTEGFPITHFCKFMENLDANPSYRARNELYGFLEACNLPITDDGCFLAYKKIRSDWKDVYSGTIDNSIGAKPTMERRDVNEDPNQTCSAGLHVCSYSYLKSYSGERIVSVKVNPADVVSCPVDYANAKLRVCAYEVMEELSFEAAQNGDTLSTRGSVVITKNKPDFSDSLEKIFKNFSREELNTVARFFDEPQHYDGSNLLAVLLTGYTYSEIRSALYEMF